MNTCPAIKTDGNVCGRHCRPNSRWCGTHGRIAAIRGEHGLIVPLEVITLRRQAVERRRDSRRRRIHRMVWFTISDALEHATGWPLGGQPVRDFHVAQTVQEPFRTYFTQLFPRIQELIADVYRDAGGTLGRAQAIANQIVLEAPRNHPAAPAPQPGELANFAHDRQNVHTTVAVRQTKDIIDRVLRIAVPAEYKSPNLKTMSEVIGQCPLNKPSAKQFADKYCADEDIYDYGPGIYARVTDSVWQFIRASPHKTDLCNILALEMNDSVGMCAQGNLTRLCNILAGYLEGVNMETQAEQLQRRMAEVSKIENDTDRLAQGRELLRELAIPDVEWQPWLDALV